jgi:hypothetical protein
MFAMIMLVALLASLLCVPAFAAAGEKIVVYREREFYYTKSSSVE